MATGVQGVMCCLATGPRPSAPHNALEPHLLPVARNSGQCPALCKLIPHPQVGFLEPRLLANCPHQTQSLICRVLCIH